MFALIRENYRYFRIKSGLNAGDIEKELQIPVPCNPFNGQIICSNNNFRVYIVNVGDSYRSICMKEGVDEEALKEANFRAPLYPTKKLYIPI